MTFARSRHRLYIDESGDHTYTGSPNPDARYLALTGVLLEDDYYRTDAHPKLEALKQRHFPHNPDEPLVLVRRRIIDRKGSFGRLKDPDTLVAWNRELLDYMAALDTTIFTCVIDKQIHRATYGDLANHPYHYCMQVMLERLLGHLIITGGTADVMAESRGGAEDQKLRNAYQDVWQNGTAAHAPAAFQTFLSSHELKLKKKEANITGLQLADLIAAPSKLELVEEHGMPLRNPASPFTRDFNRLIRPKYDSYGRVFLGK